MKEIFSGVFRKNGLFFTENLVPGFRSLSEKLIEFKGKEYRVWDPFKSKPCAGIAKGLKNFPVKKDSKILYLGVASGSTASFFSDIIGKNGIIYGVEISERSIRDLNRIAEKRKNIIPILSNAKMPGHYNWIEPVDVIYQDVASDDQSDILVRNADVFLKKRGFAMIAIKARSIDVTKEPKEIFKKETEKLKKFFTVLEKIDLHPYEKDHMLVVLRFK